MTAASGSRLHEPVFFPEMQLFTAATSSMCFLTGAVASDLVLGSQIRQTASNPARETNEVLQVQGSEFVTFVANFFFKIGEMSVKFKVLFFLAPIFTKSVIFVSEMSSHLHPNGKRTQRQG